MKPIARYEANDGSVWTHPTDAQRRDTLINMCDCVMATLEPVPTNLSGGSYVQQNHKAVALIKQRLFTIANTEGVLKWWIDSQKDGYGKTEHQLIHEVDPWWFRRMLDGDHDPLNKAYLRLSCTDALSREWNQPYYAENPPESPVCVG